VGKTGDRRAGRSNHLSNGGRKTEWAQIRKRGASRAQEGLVNRAFLGNLGLLIEKGRRTVQAKSGGAQQKVNDVAERNSRPSQNADGTPETRGGTRLRTQKAVMKVNKSGKYKRVSS